MGASCLVHALQCSSPALLYSSCPLGSCVSLWNFKTIRGSLMRSKWPKLASLAQKICKLWFQFFDAVFASKGYPFKNLSPFFSFEMISLTTKGLVALL